MHFSSSMNEICLILYMTSNIQVPNLWFRSIKLTMNNSSFYPDYLDNPLTYFGTTSKNDQEKVVVMTFKFHLFSSNIAFIDFVYFCNEWVIDSIQPTLNNIPKITEWRSKLYACSISISAKSESFYFQKL